MCENPCNNDDPCSAIGNPGNACVQPSGTCGEHVCICKADGFATGAGGQSCSAVNGGGGVCNNPCTSGGDPCRAVGNPGNACIRPTDTCDTHICLCQADGFITPSGGQTCRRKIRASEDGTDHLHNSFCFFFLSFEIC